jgi:hypothetical protein
MRSNDLTMQPFWMVEQKRNPSAALAGIGIVAATQVSDRIGKRQRLLSLSRPHRESWLGFELPSNGGALPTTAGTCGGNAVTGELFSEINGYRQATNIRLKFYRKESGFGSDALVKRSGCM